MSTAIRLFKRIPLVAALTGGLLAPGQGIAQEAGLALEEVIVTARKRVESLQDVSQSVSAMTASEIDSSFARDIRDLEGMAPNLIIDRIGAGPGVSSISIRGVTHQDVEKSFDPAVGVVLDGIFLGTNTGQELQVFDLERIEVLRGPQGTLFGRNSIGGIINVSRTDPTGEWGAKLRGTYGDYERLDLEAVVNLPKAFDVLSTKLTFVQREQDEGFVRNVEFRDDVPQVDYKSYGINFMLTPTEALTVEYTYQREEDDSDTAATSNISQPGDLLCIALARCGRSDTEPELGRLVTDQNFSNFQTMELDAHTLEVNWELGDNLTLTYLYGNRDSDEQTDQDFDSTSEDFFSTRRIQDYEQDSHELRLAGNLTDDFHLTAGLYYWDSEYTLNQTTFFLAQFLAPVTPDTTILALANQETEAEAAFFEADWAFSETWTLTLGGRYTKEDKSLGLRNDFDFLGDGTVIIPSFNIFDDRTEDDWSEFTPKASLSWHATDDMMFYGIYSKGFRSGGMNGRAGGELSARLTYDPEFVEMYELGMKSSWMNNRLQFNMALFYQEYDDKQEEVVIPSPVVGQETVTLNAAEASMSGAEFELRTLLTQGWFVAINVGLLDAEYDDFEVDQDFDGVTEDLSFLELRRAPEYTASINSAYDWNIGAGTATIQGSYRYRDDQYTTFGNEPMGLSEAHGILDAAISYQYERWNFRLFGRNLTDEEETSAALVVGGLFSFQATRDPRTWGAQITYEFQ